MKAWMVFLIGLFLSPAVVSLDLLGATKSAIDFDPTYAKVKADDLYAAQVLPEAQSKLLPQISLGAQQQFRNNDGTDQRGQSASVTVSQTLFNVPDFIALKSASGQANAAHWSTIDGYQKLLVRVASAYFRLAYQQQYMALLNKEVQSNYHLWRQAKQRYKAGQIILSDVLSARAAYNGLLGTVEQSKIDLVSDQVVLAQLTGQSPQLVSVLGLHTITQSIKPAELSDWLKLSAKYNPALLSAKERVRSANNNIHMSQSGHLPTINADASYVTSSNRIQNFNLNSQGNTINISLNFPIFSGGSVLVDTQSKRYQYASSRALLNQTHVQLVGQIRKNFYELKQGPIQIKQLKLSAKAQYSAYKTLLVAYQHGLSTMTEVLNANNLWYQNQGRVLQARYNYVNALILIKQAAGILSFRDFKLINQWLS